MTVTITINCDNDAFDNDPTWEVARILRDTANKVEGSGTMRGFNLRDRNGNTVGKVAVTGK